jgi:hypothetical protein
MSSIESPPHEERSQSIKISCVTSIHSQHKENDSGSERDTTMRSHVPKESSGLALMSGMTRDSIDFIVHDPLASGFLSKYCEAHYCSENINFITEIDRFQDEFIRDKVNWASRGNWRTIDAEINLANAAFTDANNFDIQRDFVVPLKDGSLISKELWPSKIISRDSIIESIISIWDNFLAKDAKFWICIPSTALLNTMRRIKFIHLYGKEVFSEALKEPIKTIEKDIHPRFIGSEEYRLMISSIKNCSESPALAANLKLSKPPFIILQRYTLKEIGKNVIKFKLSDLIDDQILYGEFLVYLEKIVSSENLLCLRAIRIFKDSITSQSREEKSKAFDHAWIVYKYFVASGSPYEISIAARRKKEVMRQLASPTERIFDAIEQSALSVLKTHYANYQLTKEYSELCKMVIAKRNTIVAEPTLMTTNSRSNANSLRLPPAAPEAHIQSRCFFPIR